MHVNSLRQLPVNGKVYLKKAIPSFNCFLVYYAKTWSTCTFTLKRLTDLQKMPWWLNVGIVYWLQV